MVQNGGSGRHKRLLAAVGAAGVNWRQVGAAGVFWRQHGPQASSGDRKRLIILHVWRYSALPQGLGCLADAPVHRADHQVALDLAVSCAVHVPTTAGRCAGAAGAAPVVPGLRRRGRRRMRRGRRRRSRCPRRRRRGRGRRGT